MTYTSLKYLLDLDSFVSTSTPIPAPPSTQSTYDQTSIQQLQPNNYTLISTESKSSFYGINTTTHPFDSFPTCNPPPDVYVNVPYLHVDSLQLRADSFLALLTLSQSIHPLWSIDAGISASANTIYVELDEIDLSFEMEVRLDFALELYNNTINTLVNNLLLYDLYLSNYTLNISDMTNISNDNCTSYDNITHPLSNGTCQLHYNHTNTTQINATTVPTTHIKMATLQPTTNIATTLPATTVFTTTTVTPTTSIHTTLQSTTVTPTTHIPTTTVAPTTTIHPTTHIPTTMKLINTTTVSPTTANTHMHQPHRLHYFNGKFQLDSSASKRQIERIQKLIRQ